MSIEVHDGVTAEVGRMQVRRVLPRRRLRTIGAWCFADHMGPAEVTETAGLDVGPHPHTGLQTVTWLMEGAVLHRDSLGSEQLIRPGQVNLMTAGRGVVHAEENTGTYRGTLQGMQLWVAQPDDVRHGDPGFEHHADLPVVEWDRRLGDPDRRELPRRDVARGLRHRAARHAGDGPTRGDDVPAAP